MTPVSRILIADDHGVFLEGMKEVIASTANLVVAAEAADGEEVLAKVAADDYDLLVLDICLSGRSGLDILTEIKSINPNLPVLVLSMHAEERYAVRALELGAAGYLNKGSSSQELIEAMERMVSGEKYLTPSMAKLLTGSVGRQPRDLPHERLSGPEYQVMLMIAGGATTRNIADELMVGTRRISSYRTRILQKMELASNADLARYAACHQLL